LCVWSVESYINYQIEYNFVAFCCQLTRFDNTNVVHICAIMNVRVQLMSYWLQIICIYRCMQRMRNKILLARLNIFNILTFILGFKLWTLTKINIRTMKLISTHILCTQKNNIFLSCFHVDSWCVFLKFNYLLLMGFHSLCIKFSFCVSLWSSR
jgi:hypothetical protein